MTRLQLDMSSSRLEAFSDGVIAIIVTIMVLEFKVPHDPNPQALINLWPVFLSYGLSFFMVAVYWVNHHHMFHRAKKVDSFILWANNLFLFCLSLIPFFTSYMNDHERNAFSTAMYSGILLICAGAFSVLRTAIKRQFKNNPDMMKQGQYASHKNWLAMVIYILAICSAFIYPMVSLSLNAIVACMYAMPNFYSDKK